MTRFRGVKGRAALGGAFTGSPLIQGAVAQGVGAATIDGAALNGVIRPGDKFTVAGDAQEYTIVTGGVIGSVTPNELAISFTPNVVPGGGWADNAAVSFTSNSVAQVKEWSLNPSRPFLDGVCMGDEAQVGDLDQPKATGRIKVLFDYGDTKQKAYVDELLSNNAATALALTLVVAPGKQFWGDTRVVSGAVTSRRGAYVEADLVFESEGAWGANWN